MTEEVLEETALAPSELIELFKHRSATYGLLSRLYAKEVDAELLDELHDTLWPIETGTDAGDTGNRLIATYLSGIWENTLTELAADYMRTFFGHGYSGHAAAYPFESVYSSEKRLLMQSARDEVLALYRAAGPSKQESWSTCKFSPTAPQRRSARAIPTQQRRGCARSTTSSTCTWTAGRRCSPPR